MSFSFGTPSSAPATTGLSGGFSFGANKPATPSFGLGTTATSAAPFGTGTPAFGSTPTFGATSTAPAFGSATATPAFGTSATPAPAFGASAAVPAFGTTPAPTFGATSTAPAFGATSTTPAFGAASATPAFGAVSTPAFGATTSSFVTGLGTGLGFSTTSSTDLAFGTTTTSSGLGGLGGFGFGSTTTTTTTTSAAASSGLGGTAPTSGTTSAIDGKSEPPKQTKLPNEIATTVDTFKEFVKKQKSLSSDIMRVSIKPLQKVGREAECTLRAALSLHSETSRCRAQSRRLRTTHAAGLAAVETASQPPGLDFEGAVPPAYTKELISELEQQLITFRRQMEVADKQMQSSPKTLTEQEVTLGIRRMHESLVALAGRLQSAHSAVDAQHQQYRNLRQYILKEPPQLGHKQSSGNTSLDQILQESTRKKNKSFHLNDTGLNSAVLADPRAALGNIQQLAGPTPFSYLGGTMSPFVSTDTIGSNWQPTPQANVNTSQNISAFGAQTDSFQLQRPPGKRGKQ